VVKSCWEILDFNVEAIDNLVSAVGLIRVMKDKSKINVKTKGIIENIADTRYPIPESFNFQIQYISQGATIQEHLDNIEKVCQAGIKWIQLRLKNVSLIEYLNAAKKCRVICDTYEAVLIINDNVGIAAESQADGVHVGLTDINPKEARKQLGENAIIGGTANTLEDCLQHINDGVDYIGLGPFKFTTTKNKLSPVLGIEGYQKIIDQLKKQGHQIPVIAIGGITTEDTPELSKTGIRGIAVSGLLTGISISITKLQNRINELKRKNSK